MPRHRYKQLFSFVLLAVLGTPSYSEVSVIASKSDGTTVNSPTTIAQTVFQTPSWRQYAPLARPQELKAIAAANNQLALDLYHAYRNDQATINFAFSPFDIAQTLAMTAVGARGDTLTALLNELRVTLPAGRVHPAMSAAIWNLMQRNQAGGLQQRNALWSQGRSPINQQAYYRFSPLFLIAMALYYNPEMEAVDFTNPSIRLAATEINP